LTVVKSLEFIDFSNQFTRCQHVLTFNPFSWKVFQSHKQKFSYSCINWPY